MESRFLKKLELVTHTTKLNAGNPSDSLETEPLKFFKDAIFLELKSPNELTVVK